MTQIQNATDTDTRTGITMTMNMIFIQETIQMAIMITIMAHTDGQTGTFVMLSKLNKLIIITKYFVQVEFSVIFYYVPCVLKFLHGIFMELCHLQ